MIKLCSFDNLQNLEFFFNLSKSKSASSKLYPEVLNNYFCRAQKCKHKWSEARNSPFPLLIT